jgi:16S rRNA (guanine966-N2)-methyltransferase
LAERSATNSPQALPSRGRGGRGGGGGRLRVHGGEAGGRRLAGPRGVRPTQGLVKEAIFNSLGAATAGANVLDLFAGSGALGIEALSRGAAHATFVERDWATAQVILRNLESLGYRDRARVDRMDVVRWLSTHLAEACEATLVFLDPPYNDPILERALASLSGLLSEGTTVVVERAARQALPVLPRLSAVRERRYGDTAVTFLEIV